MICIVDATNLERNLYLALQILELQVPMLLALNMIDEANKKQIFINRVCPIFWRAISFMRHWK